MLKFIFKLFYLFLVNGFLFYVIEYYVWPSVITIDPNISGHIIIGGIFALINICLKPVVKILALPFRWLTLGLFGIAINGILLYILSWFLGQTEIANVLFIIDGGILTYLLLGIILGLGNYLLVSRCDKR